MDKLEMEYKLLGLIFLMNVEKIFMDKKFRNEKMWWVKFDNVQHKSN